MLPVHHHSIVSNIKIFVLRNFLLLSKDKSNFFYFFITDVFLNPEFFQRLFYPSGSGLLGMRIHFNVGVPNKAPVLQHWVKHTEQKCCLWFTLGGEDTFLAESFKEMEVSRLESNFSKNPPLSCTYSETCITFKF